LYIKKIGAIIKKPYLTNYYEHKLGKLNYNIDTDRFIAILDLKKNKSNQYNDISQFELITTININTNELIDFKLNSFNKIAVEIPYNFQELKIENIELAKQWRLKTRQIFDYYLNIDKTVINFISIDKRNFYLME